MTSSNKVRIPLKKEVVFCIPPYAIYEYTAKIEMPTQSITNDGKVCEVRPNIYINKEYVDVML